MGMHQPNLSFFPSSSKEPSDFLHSLSVLFLKTPTQRKFPYPILPDKASPPQRPPPHLSGTHTSSLLGCMGTSSPADLLCSPCCRWEDTT